jgi:hypothetical protein
MSNRVMGRAQIKADGKIFDSHRGATLDIGGVSRESVVGANKVHGFKEAVKQAKIELEISIKAGTSLAEIGRWDDVTVTFEADTGQTWVLSNGWVTEPPTLTDSDGKAKIVIEGPPAEEMMS